MYAIIKTGGKQYIVREGMVLDVELQKDKEVGAEILFNDVLLVRTDNGVRQGASALGGCVVKATLLKNTKGPKVIAYKYKKRKNYRRKVGHRQNYHRVQIKGIEG